MNLHLTPELVRKVDKSDEVDLVKYCALMMSASSPWKQLLFSYDQCLGDLSSPEIELHIVESDCELIAFMATNAVGIEGEPLLVYLCVAAEYRRRGCGSFLLRFLEHELFPTADNLYLFVSDINVRARVLYERLGYICVGELSNYNLENQTEYLYRLTRRPRQESSLLHSGMAAAISESDHMQVSDAITHLSVRLTAEQNEGMLTVPFDLATGYPQLPMDPEFLVKSPKESMFVDPIDKPHLMLNFQQNLCRFLRVHQSHIGSLRVTSTGSIALNRSFSAICSLSFHRGRCGTTFLVPPVCIDLYHLIASEFTGSRVVPISWNPKECDWLESIKKMVHLEAKCYPNRQIAIVLDSPSNPFGETLSERQILSIVSTCKLYNAVLIIDHCFLMSGVHFPNSAASVFSLEIPEVEWIGIWDTGKTFDVHGDKIAVILSSGGLLGTLLDHSIDVLQSRNSGDYISIAFFNHLIQSSYSDTYLRMLSECCKRNLSVLANLDKNRWHTRLPSAGTFVCLYDRQHASESRILRRELLDVGVATVSGYSFQFGNSDHYEFNSFVRLSLARPSSYFDAAINRIMSLC